MADVYRNSFGRFTTERGATFKQSDGKQFVRLFGAWRELVQVTPESFRARMAKHDAALRMADNGRIQPSAV